MVDGRSCQWVTIPGCDPPVKLQIQKGQPLQILRAFVADYNEFVEPVRDADSACWTRTNSVGSSNHLSGTAVDLRWDSHPFHVSYGGFTPEKTKAMRDLLAFYTYEGQKIIWWGQDWGEQGIGPYDCMHSNLAPGTFNNPKTQAFIDKFIRPDGRSTYRRGDAAEVPVVAVTGKKVLPFDTKMIPQETGYWCGPASAQIVLKVRGIDVSEAQLARECGTTTGGTDHIRLIERVLDRRLPEANYTSVDMPNDPPTPAQKEKLWADIVKSIDAGYAVLGNLVAPPSNYPQGFAYGGGTVFHYITFTGYDSVGARQVQLSDPGFRPFQGWISFDQAATLLPPKGYIFADVAPVQKTQPVLVIDHKGAAPTHQEVHAAVAAGLKSVSLYRTPGEGAVGDVDRFIVSDDGMLHGLWIEWSAIMAGDSDAIYRILRSAAGRGADTSDAAVRRARAVLGKVPKDYLASALAQIEQADPDLLKAVLA